MKRKHSAYYLMSLANKPTKELVSLMRDNSFLFPVCADTYEVFEGDTYSINDCIYGSYALNIQDYNNISVGYASVPGYQNRFFQNISSMFVNYKKRDMTKKISDFLFHFLYEMNGNSSGEFSDKMKPALVEITKYIIGEEINANLDGIHPVYNLETMTPSFQVFFTFLLMCSSQQNHALNMARSFDEKHTQPLLYKGMVECTFCLKI